MNIVLVTSFNMYFCIPLAFFKTPISNSRLYVFVKMNGLWNKMREYVTWRVTKLVSGKVGLWTAKVCTMTGAHITKKSQNSPSGCNYDAKQDAVLWILGSNNSNIL